MACSIKGVWHEIFDFRFFSWIRVPWAHEYSLGAVSNFFENSRRYSRMNFYHRCQRHQGLILVTDFQWSPVSLITEINLSPVTTTPAINLSPVTMTPAINLLPVTTTSVIRVCGVSMNTSFHGDSNETIGGRVRLRRLCPTSAARAIAVLVWSSFGASMDASFHGGSNDTIGGRVRPQRPEILLSYCQHCLFAVVVDTGKLFFGGAVETGDKVAQRHWRIESPANIS